MPAAPKRRFLKLTTNEVSLVDKPANEVEFLVTKNTEEEVMGEQQGTTNADAERVEVEQPAGGESDAAAILKHVGGIVDNIATLAKAAGGAAPAQVSAPAVVAAAGEAGDAEVVEKAVTLGDVLKAGGLTDEQMKKLKAAGFDPNQKFPTAKPPTSKTKKAASEEADEDDEILSNLATAITKAKKFTPGRVEKLKAAFDTIKGLLEEITEIPAGSNPGVSTPAGSNFGSGLKTMLTDTAKAVEPASAAPSVDVAAITKAVGDLTEVVKGLASKVEVIEKAKPAPASETDSVKTSKSASIWSGVL